MGKVTITLCIIAKNEAGDIGDCIKSCSGYVDEVVVVDTGSGDRTPEIAKELGAKVIFDVWQDDFSKARNISLEHASGDWILFLDCDEVLAEGSGPKLRELTANSRFQAYYVTVRNIVGNRAELKAPSVRLFRNKKEFRFKGRLHEQIVSAIVSLAGIDSIGMSDVEILHYGYDVFKANVKAKVRRNMEILKKYPPSEKDGFYLYNLGTEYFRSNDLNNALWCYLKALKVTKPSKSYGPILVKRTMGVLIRLKRYEEAIRRLRFYQGVYKEYSDLVYLEGMCHMNCGRYTLAYRCFHRFLHMPAPPQWFPTNAEGYSILSRKNIERIDKKLRPGGMQGLSICIIGRNEQDQVASCIRSVNEIASEVIYVDTGSTDGSRDIAAELGAKVLSVSWEKDYSGVKNLAIENSSGPWVLVLDSDEVLSRDGFWELASLLIKPEFSGYLVGIRNHMKRGRSDGTHISVSVRLFRKEWGFVFPGYLGESAVTNDSGVCLGLTGVIIEHMHFCASKEHVDEKKKWKQEVIDKLEMEHDRNYYKGLLCYFHSDYATAHGFFSSSPCTARRYYYHAVSVLALSRTDEANSILEEGIRRFPDYIELYYLLARSNLSAGHYRRAEDLLLECIKMGESSYEKYIVIPGCGSYRALCLLAGLYHKIELPTRAVGALMKVFEILVQEELPSWSKSDATSLAVYTLVTLNKYLEKPVKEILMGYGVTNVSYFCVAARAFSALGRFDESIKYLQYALEFLSDNIEVTVDIDRITQELERLWRSCLVRFGQFSDNESFFRKVGLTGSHRELDKNFPHSI